MTAADLEPIVEPDVNVLHLRRPAATLDAEGLAALVGGAAPFDTKVRLERATHLEVRAVVDALAAGLPAGVTRDALAADLEALLLAYAGLRGARSLQAALWLGERVMCPKFHADNVGLRLLCTYTGPGTEWVADADVDRTHLSCADHGAEEANRLIVRDPTKIVRAAARDVLVLKGDAFRGNRGRGAVHRTPPDAGACGKRLVFKVDDLAPAT